MEHKTNKIVRRTAIGTTVITALVIGQSQLAGANIAFDDEMSNDREITVEGEDRRASLQEASSELNNYSEHEVLQLLLAGKGPITEANPDIEQSLGFHPDRQEISNEKLDIVVNAYLEFDPEFTQERMPQLTSGNPEVLEPALIAFYENVVRFFENDPIFEDARDQVAAATNDDPLRSGVGTNSQNVNNVQNVNQAVNVNVGVNAIGAATVGVAAVAAVFVLVAVVYLDDDPVSPSNGIDRDGMLRDLATAIS